MNPVSKGYAANLAIARSAGRNRLAGVVSEFNGENAPLG